MTAGREGARHRRTWWLIVDRESGFLEVMALGLAGGERVVPVFSFEEEAELFLRLGAPEGGWLVRETGAWELASLLLGPLSDAGWVALDPLPGRLGGMVVSLLSTDREGFVESLLLPTPRPRELGRERRGDGPPQGRFPQERPT